MDAIFEQLAIVNQEAIKDQSVLRLSTRHHKKGAEIKLRSQSLFGS